MTKCYICGNTKNLIYLDEFYGYICERCNQDLNDDVMEIEEDLYCEEEI